MVGGQNARAAKNISNVLDISQNFVTLNGNVYHLGH
jgi:hypothetical protein